MESFLTALVVLFLAELGDKTQVMALVLATRYNGPGVVTGLAGAIVGTQGLSVLGGNLLSNYLSGGVVTILAGSLFVGFGIYLLLQPVEDEEEPDAPSKSLNYLQAAATTFGLISLAELGDKSMIATAGLATRYGPLETWAGASTGMFLAGLIGYILGRWLGWKLNERILGYVSGSVFLLIGVGFLGQYYW